MNRKTGYILMTALAGSALARASQRPGPERLRAEIHDILAQPAYQQPDIPWLVRIWQRVLDWVAGLFDWWAPGVEGIRAAWPALFWGIVILLCAALALLLYHIIWTLSYMFRSRERPKKAKGPGRVADPGDLRELAARLAREGRHGEAIGLLYEALIRFLDRMGVLHFDPSRTNWEYVDAARSVSGLAAAMEPLARSLDGILYGGATPGAEDFEACRELSEQARASVEVAE